MRLVRADLRDTSCVSRGMSIAPIPRNEHGHIGPGRRRTIGMDNKKVVALHKEAPDNDMCGRCHMQVARFAPQVNAEDGKYHRECFEAWYFGQHGRRPSLLAGVNGDRHRFQVRDRIAA
jgi:hypothetical protein